MHIRVVILALVLAGVFSVPAESPALPPQSCAAYHCVECGEDAHGNLSCQSVTSDAHCTCTIRVGVSICTDKGQCEHAPHPSGP